MRKSRGVDLPLPDIIEACVRRASAPSRPGATRCSRRPGRRLAAGARARLRTLRLLPRRHVPAADAAGLQAARDDNRRAVDEARNCARLPGAGGRRPARRAAGQAAHKDIALARSQVRTASPNCWSTRAGRMPLAIEPLHPMYAADRACVNTLEQALDLCDELDAAGRARWASPWTSTTCGGTRNCSKQIARAGRERLLAFHVCDWLTPTTDLLNDRGMMGDGVIDIPRIRGWVEAQGFAGYSEVEIFSTGNWWQRRTTRCWTPASRGTARWSEDLLDRLQARTRRRGGAGAGSGRLDLAGELAALLDHHLAVAHLAGDLAGREDDQLLAHGQVAVEQAADFGDVDFGGALERTALRDLDHAESMVAFTEPSTTRCRNR
jgi:sugar phosphate isomerase/epimerase